MKKQSQAWLVVGFMLFGMGCMNMSTTGTASDSDAVGLGESEAAVGCNCVDKAAKNLGISLEMKTKPTLIAEVLRDDMLLSDLPSAAELLSKSLKEPVSLKPMLIQIRRAISAKQPAVSEFLCAAIDAKLIPKVKDAASAGIVDRVIHHTYILNEITLKMASSYQFQIEVQNHLLAKRAKFGIRTDLVGALEDLKELYGGQMFGPTKVVSMDLTNALLAKTRASGVMPPETVTTFKGALKLNILEAAVTENLVGYNDNAMAGAVLAAIPPKNITLAEGSTNSQWDLSQNWDSLYETWNLAFITGNVTYLHIYYPKLLIPAVIDADPMSYISNRAMSLWISLNFRQFAAAAGKADHPVPNKEELSTIWGGINRKYAEKLAVAETGYPIDAFAPMLNTTLAQIMEYMKQSFSAVPLSPEDQARMAALYATP